MATIKQRHAQFQKGLGVYKCRCCTRKTRGSGGDSAGVQLCDQCYELAGFENMLQDGGELSIAEANSIISYCNEVEAKGGSLEQWMSLLAQAQALSAAKARELAARPVVDEAAAGILPTDEEAQVAIAGAFAASRGDLPRTPVETREGWFEQYLPAPEACARIRALGRGRKVMLSVMQEGRTSADKHFPILGHITVGRHAAMEWVTDAYKGFTERGALVRLVWCSNALFVG